VVLASPEKNGAIYLHSEKISILCFGIFEAGIVEKYISMFYVIRLKGTVPRYCPLKSSGIENEKDAFLAS
jgi:hypothetical protein